MWPRDSHTTLRDGNDYRLLGMAVGMTALAAAETKTYLHYLSVSKQKGDNLTATTLGDGPDLLSGGTSSRIDAVACCGNNLE